MTTDATRERVTIERTYDGAAIDDVWEMWTTKEGLEAWWGPDGFSTEVRALDVRPGGTLVYAMTARDPGQVEFMRKAGMPMTNETRGRYTIVDPPRRLAFTQLADFIPGVEPYDIATTVDFHATANGVRLVVTIDRMHDAHWTEMAVKGWESQLGRLGTALAPGTL
ncbi:MAG: SRPBCC domain-containing protein [Gemmatimonadaceae bacterium]